VTALVDLLFLLVGITLGAFVMYARQRGERAAIDALLERAKNDLREATTHQAGERVGQIVAPIAERLTEFDRMVREIENKRSEDSGALREQLTQLLGRADKIETAANALSNQTSTLVTALRSPTTRGKWGEIQLRNVVERLLIMAPGDARQAIRTDMLPPEIGAITPAVLKWDKGGEIMGLPLREAREVFEREYLLAQVNRFAGNISRTASFVGMERSALHRKLKMLGVNNGERPPAKLNS